MSARPTTGPQLVSEHETAREDLRNAIAILRNLSGAKLTIEEISEAMLAIYRRVESALAKLDSLERRIRPHTLSGGAIETATRDLL